LREAYLHRLPELVKILRRECVRSTECQRAVKQRLLNLNKQLLHRPGNTVLGNEALPFLAWPIAKRQHDAAFGDVFGPISIRKGTPRISQSLNLKPGALSFALVHFDANLRIYKLFADFLCGREDQRLFFIRS